MQVESSRRGENGFLSSSCWSSSAVDSRCDGGGIEIEIGGRHGGQSVEMEGGELCDSSKFSTKNCVSTD